MELRDNLIEIAMQKGKDHLYDLLKEEDSVAAEKIHANDLRRIVRALEVCMAEKEKYSEIKKERNGLWGKYDISIYCLNCGKKCITGVRLSTKT